MRTISYDGDLVVWWWWWWWWTDRHRKGDKWGDGEQRQTDRQTERMEGQIMICFFISYQDMCGGGGGWWWWKGWTDRHRKEDKWEDGEQTDRQTERTEGKIMICFFISYQNLCVLVGGGGWGGAGQTGIEKEINKERRTETDRQRGQRGRKEK